MKILLFLLTLFFASNALTISPWLKKLDVVDKVDRQEQLDLRWVASGGEMDIQFIHHKLKVMKIGLLPKPQFPNKPWSQNHLVFPISKNSNLKIQVPYGSIEKVTDSGLTADTNFSLSYGKKKINISKLTFVHNEKKDKDLDIVTFKLLDQHGRHLFNTDHVHIQYSKDRKLLQMKHMDISASKGLAKLLNMPELANQLLGQVNTYSYLSIPTKAQFDLKGTTCLSNPSFQNSSNFTDIQLVNMASIDWLGNVNGSDELILVPSAQLLNVGTADVPWYDKFSGVFPPYNNDQHPYLTWSVYREIDNRFEQIGLSGLKHAFFATNVNCSCPGGNVLGVGCGDVYAKASNDLVSALGPRDELVANSGIWQNCGSFFDPIPCAGNQQNFTGSTLTGENRLSIDPADIVPNLYMQAWYIVRDDVNIFNSMGYKSFSPTLISTTWVMNTNLTFNSGAALDNYVPTNTMNTMQASQTVDTGEGQFTVAVKVVDLGAGLYRYNYAIENYAFDPRFINYQIPLDDLFALTDMVFVDPDHDTANDWQFVHNNGVLTIQGDASNEQDWGMMFSFSFTTNVVPIVGEILIDAAQTPINPMNNTVIATTLVPAPDLIFLNGFE